MRASIPKPVRRLTLWAGVITGVVALALASTVSGKPGGPITEPEVEAAQRAWCNALVRISTVHRQGGDYKKLASELIDELYDYQDGEVFFKPTLASGPNTFRPTKEGALSYFVGGNPRFPEDDGFALKGWAKVDYDNSGGGSGSSGIQIHGNVAVTMGYVYLTDRNNKTIKVDKTFAFRKSEKDGKLRLILHHSSLPFEPCPEEKPAATKP